MCFVLTFKDFESVFQKVVGVGIKGRLGFLKGWEHSCFPTPPNTEICGVLSECGVFPPSTEENKILCSEALLALSVLL